ncbi:hypothetical protein SYJ56_04160 [Algoriphagus sp. D3-2-R+10]|uniref:hypothetical protein n=1 Tax=Algoriphagus aurantiacus TaxID=3103948 RepID=UPI002B3A260B|nr:hypothetical protein [Algoriphagus sp. D3-2-R+10]MEB2774485.1 hypothetical protein [Algoriphagus sp. D3-2-R+10]
MSDFLSEKTSFSWTVVSGPGGSGKSRLVQELCVDSAPYWRAGFLAPGHSFVSWATWKPYKNTLIIIDYAAERIDEARNIFNGLVQNQQITDGHLFVRVILVEREGKGQWLEKLLGNRSERYVLEQVRYSIADIELTSMSEEVLWEGLNILNQDQTASLPLPPREQLISDLKVIDPLCRPLYTILATDALISGRNIRLWDRERLMLDVLGRERQSWLEAGVTRPYENLLALATMVGGLTEAVLEQTDLNIDLPNFESFDRNLYSAMSGCALEGEDLPPLKPDLVGEFFVLNHIKGRNERLTAKNARDLSSAAWKICGGSEQRNFFIELIKYVSPSKLIFFLNRLIIDYGDHPAAIYFLYRPEGPDIDLLYWGSLVVAGIHDNLSSGKIENARLLFSFLSSLKPDELRTIDAEDMLVKAAFTFLSSKEWLELPEDPNSMLQLAKEQTFKEYSTFSTRLAYCHGSANAINSLLTAGKNSILNQILDDQYILVQEHPEENQLQAQYARSLRILVCSEGELEQREAYLETLRSFCKHFENNIMLYVELAKAADSLINIYLNSDRIGDAERMNQIIRGLYRLRTKQRIIQNPSSYEDIMDFKLEVYEDDIVELEYTLAKSDLWLIEPFILAKRYRDSNYLLKEINRIWQMRHPKNPDYAILWGYALMKDADACSQLGQFNMIAKAVKELNELAEKFPDHQAILGFSSKIATIGFNCAIAQMDIPLAEEMFAIVKELANPPQACQEAIVNYADCAFKLCTTYQEKKEDEKSMRVIQDAILALRSETYKQVLLARSSESSIHEFYEWLDKVETWPD